MQIASIHFSLRGGRFDVERNPWAGRDCDYVIRPLARDRDRSEDKDRVDDDGPLEEVVRRSIEGRKLNL